MKIIFSNEDFQILKKFEMKGRVNLKRIRDYIQKLYPKYDFCYCILKLYSNENELLDEYNDEPEDQFLIFIILYM